MSLYLDREVTTAPRADTAPVSTPRYSTGLAHRATSTPTPGTRHAGGIGQRKSIASCRPTCVGVFPQEPRAVGRRLVAPPIDGPTCAHG